jgi:hypothetical protein
VQVDEGVRLKVSRAAIAEVKAEAAAS